MNRIGERSDEIGTTIISVIAGIAQAEEHIRRQQMERFIQQYGAPLQSHIEHRAHVDTATAEDLLHDFLVDKLLENSSQKNLAQRYVEKRSETSIKFRGYLLRSLNNYLIDRHRSPKIDAVSLHEEFGDGASAQASTGENRFAVEWAENLIQKTIDLVRQDCKSAKQEQIWQVFDLRILEPARTGLKPIDYDQLVDRLGFATAKEASNRLQTSIRKFNRVLRGLIRDYLPYGEGKQLDQAVEDEIDDLRSVLRSTSNLSIDSSDDLESIPATAITHVASLFELKESSDHFGDNERDLSQLWRHLLRSRVDVLFQFENSNPARQTLSDFLQDPTPQLDSLQVIKQQAKASAFRSEQANSPQEQDGLPYSVNVLLYTLAIALADLRHGIRITRDSNRKIAPRLRVILETSWLDEYSRGTLNDWHEQILAELTSSQS